MRKLLKFIIGIVICLIVVSSSNVQAKISANSVKTDELNIQNADNTYNKVSKYITVLQKGESTTIEIFDFIVPKEEFKLENYVISISEENVINTVSTTTVFDDIAKISMKLNSKECGIANIVVEKNGIKNSYTIIVVEDKTKTFDGYIIEDDNTLCVYSSDYESQITDEIKDKAWKISISSNEYNEEYLGTEEEESDIENYIPSDDGAVTPNENNQNIEDIAKEEKKEEKKEDAATTDIPQAGEFAMIPILIIGSIVTLFGLIVILKNNRNR